jgi:hypothetical protein
MGSDHKRDSAEKVSAATKSAQTTGSPRRKKRSRFMQQCHRSILAELNWPRKDFFSRIKR